LKRGGPIPLTSAIANYNGFLRASDWKVPWSCQGKAG
jgi:hypothetical protein